MSTPASNLHPALGSLCGDTSHFTRHVWEQQPLHTQATDLGDLFTLADADRLALRGGTPAPHHVRLTKKQQADDAGEAGDEPDDLVPWLRTMHAPGDGTPVPMLDPAGALAHFDAGRTMVFHGIGQLMPRVADFLHDLQADVSHPCGANAYLTPPHEGGLGVHYDSHDVFVVQTHGEKHWEIWSPHVEAPTPDYSPRQHDVVGEPEHLVMRAGDVLYIPRGWPHRARTAELASLHVTISIKRITYLDVARSIVENLLDEAVFRQALPVGFLHDQGAVQDLLSTRLGELAERVRDYDTAAVLSGIQNETVPSGRPPVGRLVDLIAAKEGTSLDGSVRRGSAFDRLERVNEHEWVLTTPDHAAALPAAFAPAFQRLHDGDDLLISEIAPDIQLQVREVVTNQLLRHGVLALS